MPTCSKHISQPDPGCFRCKLVSIQFGNVEPPPQRAIESQRERDLPAYQRLRQQGLQPKATKGCHELESRAHSQFEIDMHKLVDKGLWGKTKNQIEETQHAVQEGMRHAKDQGIGVEQIKEWKDTARKKEAV